ncbi:sensor histidine kinase [Paenibacillus sp. NPDC093718]|uniref:sensor histidine kinase n=1 Tax=Paenibacillus sp. NPDC093718 TaxID=3390601 RepID=UPI003CFF1756
MAMNWNKLAELPLSDTVALTTNPMTTAEVIVEAVDFFLMPNDKGIKLMPAIIKALSTVAGTAAIMASTAIEASNKPIIGFKRYVNRLIMNVVMIILKKQNPNTIVNLGKGYSALLLNDQYEWSKEEAISFIREMDDKGKHMEELIQDLSLVTQLNRSDGTFSLQKTNQDIVEFTKRVVADISNNPQASSYHIHFQADSPAIQVDFDSKFMQRILQNIMMNSILHNPVHTDIYVQIADIGEHAVVRIKDNGVGMPADLVEHLFQQYYRGTTTDSSSEGTGLGMAIVYKLVQAHEGTIDVESEASQGTSFTIRLPKN